jgi:hypothetical protein
VRTGDDWIVSSTMSPVDYSPQITATKITRKTSGNAPSMLTLGCRSQRTEISLGTTGSWKPLRGDDVQVAYPHQQPTGGAGAMDDIDRGKCRDLAR